MGDVPRGPGDCEPHRPRRSGWPIRGARASRASAVGSSEAAGSRGAQEISQPARVEARPLALFAPVIGARAPAISTSRDLRDRHGDVGGDGQALGGGWEPNTVPAAREARGAGEAVAQLCHGRRFAVPAASHPNAERRAVVEGLVGWGDAAGGALAAVEIAAGGAVQRGGLDGPPAVSVADLDRGQRTAVGERENRGAPRCRRMGCGWRRGYASLR